MRKQISIYASTSKDSDEITKVIRIYALKIEMVHPIDIAKEMNITPQEVQDILFDRMYRGYIIPYQIWDSINSHSLKQLIVLESEFAKLRKKHNYDTEKLLRTVSPKKPERTM